VLVLSKPEETFTFVHVHSEPVPSLLRGFSAPVVLQAALGEDALFTLLSHDTDPFNRWEAAQTLALRRLLQAVAHHGHAELDHRFVEALRGVLRHPELDAAFKELVLTLPSEAYVAEQLDVVDPQLIHAARESMKLQLARQLHEDWAWAYEHHQDQGGGYEPDARSSGRRALVNLSLSMLCLVGSVSHNPVWAGKALQRFKDATNMTDRLGALSALVNCHADLAPQALDRFHALFKGESLVIDKWFTLQAGAPEKDGKVFARAKALMQHPDFTLRTPNRARSLLMVLCQSNPAAFHRPDAAGYVFWADRVIEIDSINPQLASRLARALDHWRRLAEPYRTAAREAISRVAAKPDLSDDVREIVTRALQD
jgi:aminopeptidase N